jgi:transposase
VKPLSRNKIASQAWIGGGDGFVNVPNAPALRAVVAGNPAAEAELTELFALIQNLVDQVTKMKAELAQLKTNSQTSSKPPSSDRQTRDKPKPRSSREKSGLKPGGQPGHPGHQLAASPTPDVVIVHEPPDRCPECGGDLSQAEPLVDESNEPVVESRQVIELPPPKRHVTEHLGARVVCPHCLAKVSTTFPAGVYGPVSYGVSVQATAMYLSIGQLLPSERLVEVMAELCDCPMSAGSVAPMVRRGGDAAAPVVDEIRARLKDEPWCGFDETGLSLQGKTHWLHTASSPRYTALHAHAKRGKVGILAGGVIDGYKGIAIHDFLSAYHSLAKRHGLCNAHHLRELRYLFEVAGQQWASEMMTYLRETKKRVDEEDAGGPKITRAEIKKFKARYQKILGAGYQVNPEPPPKKPGQRGRQARGKALNLLDRFKNRSKEVMAFLLRGAPFDNNHAERDLRMMKTRQKISGCFRSEDVLTAFVNIRSVVATAKKNAVGPLQAIKALLGPSPTLDAIIRPAP